jgi:site-specific recombinase XerC
MAFSIQAAASDFDTFLTLQGRADKTRIVYAEAIRQLTDFLTARGHSLEVRDVTRDDLAAFLASLEERGLAKATVRNRKRSLSSFFNYLVNVEQELEKSPLLGVSVDRDEDAPIPVPEEAAIEQLIMNVEAGRDFESRRDTAIFRLATSAGLRLGEVAPTPTKIDGRKRLRGGLLLADLDVKGGRVLIRQGKGDRFRIAAFTNDAKLPLARYLRSRTDHPFADSPWLFIGRRGPLLSGGVSDMIDRRCRQAGIEHLHFHQLRHWAAHRAKAKGLSDEVMMEQFGWRSSDMVRRYGRARARERALNMYDQVMNSPDNGHPQLREQAAVSGRQELAHRGGMGLRGVD